MIEVICRPISTYPSAETPARDRRRSPFSAPWDRTLRLLRDELGRLDGKRVVLELDLAERDIRLDGWPRATATPDSPRVVLSFDSRFGPLRYATDVFAWWQDNVRAIALGLESLRRVERYGITKRGEQYAGWRQLTMGSGEASHFTTDSALAFIAEHAEIEVGAMEFGGHVAGEAVQRAYRLAARKLHPDVGGDPAEFTRLEAARDLLLR